MLHRESQYFLPVPFGLAVCGLAFCIWNIWGADSIPCFSTGCTIFQDFSIGGISLWWGGVAGFAVLALLALSGRLYLGRTLAGLGLGIDCLLLVLMLATAPCLPCLVTALLLALTYWFFLSTAASARRRMAEPQIFSFLLAIWACLFVANLGTLGRTAFDAWPIATATEAQKASVRAYISPSCPSCRQLMQQLAPADMAKITWYPVAEQPQDVSTIAIISQRLSLGENLQTAFQTALAAPQLSPLTLLQPDMILLQFRLWRNRAHVMENGGSVPLLEFSGLPAFMLQSAHPSLGTSTQPATDGKVRPPLGHDPALPAELSIIGSCGPGSGTAQTPDVPCL